jgi:hypothetical protein
MPVKEEEEDVQIVGFVIRVNKSQSLPPMLHTHIVPLACMVLGMDSVTAYSTRRKKCSIG